MIIVSAYLVYYIQGAKGQSGEKGFPGQKGWKVISNVIQDLFFFCVCVCISLFCIVNPCFAGFDGSSGSSRTKGIHCKFAII